MGFTFTCCVFLFSFPLLKAGWRVFVVGVFRDMRGVFWKLCFWDWEDGAARNIEGAWFDFVAVDGVGLLENCLGFLGELAERMDDVFCHQYKLRCFHVQMAHTCHIVRQVAHRRKPMGQWKAFDTEDHVYWSFEDGNVGRGQGDAWSWARATYRPQFGYLHWKYERGRDPSAVEEVPRDLSNLV